VSASRQRIPPAATEQQQPVRWRWRANPAAPTPRRAQDRRAWSGGSDSDEWGGQVGVALHGAVSPGTWDTAEEEAAWRRHAAHRRAGQPALLMHDDWAFDISRSDLLPPGLATSDSDAEPVPRRASGEEAPDRPAAAPRRPVTFSNCLPPAYGPAYGASPEQRAAELASAAEASAACAGL
jgi:hypothetical protein